MAPRHPHWIRHCYSCHASGRCHRSSSHPCMGHLTAFVPNQSARDNTPIRRATCCNRHHCRAPKLFMCSVRKKKDTQILLFSRCKRMFLIKSSIFLPTHAISHAKLQKEYEHIVDICELWFVLLVEVSTYGWDVHLYVLYLFCYCIISKDSNREGSLSPWREQLLWLGDSNKWRHHSFWKVLASKRCSAPSSSHISRGLPGYEERMTMLHRVVKRELPCCNRENLTGVLGLLCGGTQKCHDIERRIPMFSIFHGTS